QGIISLRGPNLDRWNSGNLRSKLLQWSGKPLRLLGRACDQYSTSCQGLAILSRALGTGVGGLIRHGELVSHDAINVIQDPFSALLTKRLRDVFPEPLR